MINETISSIGFVINTTWNYLSKDLFHRGVDIIEAPFFTQDMLWMLLPLLATLLLMEFYFGRYKDEELGWTEAFGNALILAFVSIDLFRHLYEPSGQSALQFIALASNIKVIIPLWIAGLALVLMFVDFFHFLPKKIAYVICSPAYVNLLGLLGIIIVYTPIPLDWTTIFACIILFVIANLISLMLYYIVPSYKPTISKILTVEDIEKYGEELSKKKNDKKKEIK
jgi:hypothetical protein